MKDDYIPRVEQRDLFFPYDAQWMYRFFDDDVWIIGFYRNSPDDIDFLELFPAPPGLPYPPSFSPPPTPNQSLEPTAGRRKTSRSDD
jgi:hypothetical protein